VKHNIHVLNPLEAWNSSRSIASQLIAAVEKAESSASPDLPYDPYILENKLSESSSPVGDLWPQAAREVLYYKLQTIRKESDGDLTNAYSNTVMDLLKHEGQLMVVKEEKKENLTATNYDPDQLAHWVDARAEEVAVAIDLVQAYNTSNGSYKEIVTSDPLLENTRPSDARVELVNKNAESVVDQILHIAEWVASTNQDSDVDKPSSNRYSHAPMGQTLH